MRDAHPEGGQPLDRLEHRHPHDFGVDEDHVRFNLLEVDGAGERLGDPLGQPASPLVILVEPFRSFLERDQARGGHDPRLPPGASVEDLQAPGLSRNVGRPA